MEHALVGIAVVALPLITVALVILAYLDWKRFQYDRQRHDEAALERHRRKDEKDMEKAKRRQENAVNRLLSTVSQAAAESHFSLDGKKPEVWRTSILPGGWDGVEVRPPSTTTGPIGNQPIALALVRCTPKGDEIVVNWVGDRGPKYYDISRLEEAVSALTAFVRNYPHDKEIK